MNIVIQYMLYLKHFFSLNILKFNFFNQIVCVVCFKQLFPSHIRVGRGNPMLKHSVPHFSLNSRGIMCWAEFNTDNRSKEGKYKFNLFYYSKYIIVWCYYCWNTKWKLFPWARYVFTDFKTNNARCQLCLQPVSDTFFQVFYEN